MQIVFVSDAAGRGPLFITRRRRERTNAATSMRSASHSNCDGGKRSTAEQRGLGGIFLYC